MVRGFGSVVDRVDVGEYRRDRENGRLLTGDYFGSSVPTDLGSLFGYGRT